MRINLLSEMAFIGIATVIFTFIIYILFNKSFSSTLDFYIPFLVGALLHFVFEIVGFNESWCKMTYSII